MRDLVGIAALVTGGSSGLGLATAQALADAGAKVAALDLRPGKASAGILPIACNVADEGAVVAALEAAEADRTERAAEVDGPVHASLAIEAPPELPPEVAHQMDVGPGEAEDRLPVVTYGKEAHIRMLGLQRLHQPGSALRDVLELVDEDMAERAQRRLRSFDKPR